MIAQIYFIYMVGWLIYFNIRHRDEASFLKGKRGRDKNDKKKDKFAMTTLWHNYFEMMKMQSN